MKLESAAVDFLLCAFVMSNSMGRLWEQDVWWQLRLGDEILRGRGFPTHEEWTYTSSHVPFHNHWWLFVLPFSVLYHLGGVPALISLRGLLCGVLAKLQMMLSPGPLRWLLAAISFRISKHRLQCRPELVSLVLFAALPVLYRAVAQADAGRDKLKRAVVFWPKEVLWMYACVVAAANVHFGVVPWPVLCCGALLADDLFDPGAPGSTTCSWLRGVNLTPVLRAVPVLFLPCFSPQPLAGLHYILHHRPGKYAATKHLTNPEHRSFLEEWGEFYQELPAWSRVDGSQLHRLFFSQSPLKHVPWICVYFGLAILVVVVWFLRSRQNRPVGLKSPVITLSALGIMTYLVYDRTRTVVWPACFLTAMLGRSSLASSQPRGVAGFCVSLVLFLSSVYLVLGDFEEPSFKLVTMNWPVRSAEFVHGYNLTGNIYHTITFGGYLLYWLPNKHFADTREYCFQHLDELYKSVYLDHVRLHRDILQKHQVNIYVALIPKTRRLPMGGFEDVADRFLPKRDWARVFFDHVSEVFLRRSVPEFKDLIAEREVFLNPAFPPDYHVRVLLGRDAGNPERLKRDLDACLARGELYCELIEALRTSTTEGTARVSSWLQRLEGKDPQDLKNERRLTRLAGLILRPFLLSPVRRQLRDFSCSLAARLVKRHWQAVFKRWTMVSCDEPTRLEDAQQPLLSSAGRQSSRDSFAGHRAQGTADAGATPAGANSAAADSTLNLEPDETPRGTPADAEVFVQPSLAKGMPFHNGFLYKLGDGLLNTGWNLRYFLLIGQTLQYYRSQHEAKPRDAISLSGVSVEWSHDASRPFTFVVSKSGQRSFCLSGCTEREACEWVERIQAASAAAERPLTTPAGTRLLGVLPQPGELPEPVETGATTWQEAAMARCTQELSRLLNGADFQLRELRHGVRILQRRSSGHRGAKFAALDLRRLGSLLSTAVFVLSFCATRCFASSLASFLMLLPLGLVLYSCSWGRGAELPVLAAAVRVSGTGEEVREAELEHGDKQPLGCTLVECRFCLGGDADDTVFVAPCSCRGGQRWVHLECLRRWQRSILVTQPTHPAFYHEDRRMTHCSVCTQRFSCPLPSRHEMMMSFTGAELAASVQERCLICSSESWSAALRARIHAGLDRASISNLVHWCRGVYLIYYCGAKQLVLSIPDEANRTAVLQNLDGSGHIEVQGRQYQVLSDGPLSHLPPEACRFGESSEEAVSAPSSRRGAAWVRAVSDQAHSSRSRASRLFAALTSIQLPVDVTLQRIGPGGDASDDSIRAVNLSNRISSDDLPSAVQARMRKTMRAARLSGSPSVQLEHYLGGPCAAFQCHVFLPVGEPDGVLPPLPSGFKLLGDLHVAVGTDLVAALRALASARGWSGWSAERPEETLEEGPPRKVRRLGQEGEAHDGDGQLRPLHADDSDLEEAIDTEDEEQSADPFDFWGGNAGELAATPPPDDSSEDEADAVSAFDAADMVVGMAAEQILRGAADHAEQNHEPSQPQQLEREAAVATRPLKVFWGEARWQRTQLLGELARGDWGLCQARAGDLFEPARSLWPQLHRDQRPVVAPHSEMTRAETADAALADSWRLQEWLPGHAYARTLSLLPSRDEVVQLAFHGPFGWTFKLDIRRRWSRSDQPAARLLLCVEEPPSKGRGRADVQGFEGFAVQQQAEGSCLVWWLCALPLMPWAPMKVQEELAVQRVSSLAGLREWCQLSAARNAGAGSTKTQPSRMQRSFSGSLGSTGGMLKDSLQLQVLPQMLRPFRRAASGALHAPAEMERSAMSAEILQGMLWEAAWGGREARLSSRPNGLLPQAGGDFAQRYSSRWAFASKFLTGAGSLDQARDRLLLVIAFMVAGLHLAAAGYPYLPWVDLGCCSGRQSAVLPDDCTASLDVDCQAAPGLQVPRRAAFEVTGRSGCGFRVYGADEVSCEVQLPGSFCFTDKGFTTVEFAAPGSAASSVRFTRPSLRVRPSCWTFGPGSIYEWLGTARFFDDSAGLECALVFDTESSGAEDRLRGSLRNAAGSQAMTGHLRARRRYPSGCVRVWGNYRWDTKSCRCSRFTSKLRCCASAGWCSRHLDRLLPGLVVTYL
ncbi:unnamed protein product [Symbiodinium microadriaticum]|nr:unnamed protein product [Symbiodinium microadriaticum]